MDIEVVVADITTVGTAVVVTAANRAHDLRALRPLAPCPMGDAVIITLAFDLNPPVEQVIHAVGPRYGVY